MKLDDLAEIIVPERTVLLLGAGASVVSGAPAGNALAKQLAAKARLGSDNDELSEVAAIFERKNGRRALAEAVREIFSNLEPTGGMLAIPAFDWHAMYSTNFDRLVERSYQKAGKALNVVRSNFDFSSSQSSSATTLYKIHGCITTDVGFGDQSRMLLTEDDYDELERYRQSLFSSLEHHMLGYDTLIIGQSLRDRHLRDLARKVAGLRSQGTSGRVFLLAYDFDIDRADLYEQRGVRVAPGGLDQLLHALTLRQQSRPARVVYSSTESSGDLPPGLASSTTDVSHAAKLSPNSIKLFNGWPASYADIKSGLTIGRAIARRLEEWQRGTRGFFTVLIGAAGVGKTTSARALLLKRSEEGFACWEHSNSFALDVDAWLDVELALRKAGRQGVLLIDDCAQHMKSVNRLVDALGALDRPFLRLVLTANGSQWRSKAKSPYIFSRGSTERLSELTEGDINELINLVEQKPEIRELVEHGFRSLSRHEQVRRLRERCSADMFVCLKNIFHNENLNQIILQEFAELDEPSQDVYRLVAALQAMGGKVHRQMIVRLLGIDAGTLTALLGQLEDVVSEYDIKPREGIYGWTARHDVVAQIIATYKYADQDELYRTLARFIDSLNPTIYIEKETARSIAAHEMGIPRLTSSEAQADLLRRLTDAVPAERTPRRRLIRLHLDQWQLAEAEQEIKVAARLIGNDPIVDRYKCVLEIRRAETVEGLLAEDRRAMLLEAERLARRCISRHPEDRYNYRALADVGRSMSARFGDASLLEEAITLMREYEANVLDPAFVDERRTLEDSLRRLRRSEASIPSAVLSPEHPEESMLADSEG